MFVLVYYFSDMLVFYDISGVVCGLLVVVMLCSVLVMLLNLVFILFRLNVWLKFLVVRFGCDIVW